MKGDLVTDKTRERRERAREEIAAHNRELITELRKLGAEVKTGGAYPPGKVSEINGVWVRLDYRWPIRWSDVVRVSYESDDWIGYAWRRKSRRLRTKKGSTAAAVAADLVAHVAAKKAREAQDAARRSEREASEELAAELREKFGLKSYGSLAVKPAYRADEVEISVGVSARVPRALAEKLITVARVFVGAWNGAVKK